MTQSNEQRYYDALKRITLYQSPDRMRRSSQKDWGCDFEECIEMAYENIQHEARMAIKGKRRPKASGEVTVQVPEGAR